MQVNDVDPHGVLVLDRARRVVCANRFARSLLDGGLAPNALAKPGSDGGVIRIARRTGPPLLAASIAFPAPYDQDLDSVMLLWDPRRDIMPSGDLLRDGFGLTAAESATAIDLYEGLTPREMAEARERSINTVRTLLARVYEKCGVRRQAELVRVVADQACRANEIVIAREVIKLLRMQVRIGVTHFARGEVREFHYHTHGHEIVCALNGTLHSETDSVRHEVASGEAHHVPSSLVHRGANRDDHASLRVLVINIQEEGRPFKVVLPES